MLRHALAHSNQKGPNRASAMRLRARGRRRSSAVKSLMHALHGNTTRAALIAQHAAAVNIERWWRGYTTRAPHLSHREHNARVHAMVGNTAEGDAGIAEITRSVFSTKIHNDDQPHLLTTARRPEDFLDWHFATQSWATIRGASPYVIGPLDGQGRGYAVRQSQSQKPYGPNGPFKGLLAHRRPPPTSGGLNTSSKETARRAKTVPQPPTGESSPLKPC